MTVLAAVIDPLVHNEVMDVERKAAFDGNAAVWLARFHSPHQTPATPAPPPVSPIWHLILDNMMTRSTNKRLSAALGDLEHKYGGK